MYVSSWRPIFQTGKLLFFSILHLLQAIIWLLTAYIHCKNNIWNLKNVFLFLCMCICVCISVCLCLCVCMLTCIRMHVDDWHPFQRCRRCGFLKGIMSLMVGFKKWKPCTISSCSLYSVIAVRNMSSLVVITAVMLTTMLVLPQ